MTTTALDLYRRESDAFWDDMRKKARTLQDGIAQLEEEADDLLLDLTRAGMAAER